MNSQDDFVISETPYHQGVHEKTEFLNTSKTFFKSSLQQLKKGVLLITSLFLIFIAVCLLVAFLITKSNLTAAKHKSVSYEKSPCNFDSQCTLQVVETLPPVLAYNSTHDSISNHWLKMIKNAKRKIDILSFYWTLKSSDVEGGPYSQAEVGEKVLEALKHSAVSGRI